MSLVARRLIHSPLANACDNTGKLFACKFITVGHLFKFSTFIYYLTDRRINLLGLQGQQFFLARLHSYCYILRVLFLYNITSSQVRDQSFPTKLLL